MAVDAQEKKILGLIEAGLTREQAIRRLKQLDPSPPTSRFARRRVAKFFTEPSMVRPEFQAEADINNILAKYARSGVLPSGERQARFGDFSNLPDAVDAFNAVAIANEAFANLPSKVRKYFENDPKAFMEAFQDEDMRPELERLGLLKKPSKADKEQSDVEPVKPAATRQEPVQKKKTPSGSSDAGGGAAE